ncbi:trypsin-like peptidase domain-containing protein [Microlunatus ginsengisoli]|uniref:trypsin-like peptidase domain-containing protein n=1 Tax=Microlunatus ginsengisoli TaxID=363863 RepID=UPI0031D01FB1
MAATALSAGMWVVPASANPPTTETKLAEYTNPAVQIITTEYHATVKLGRIEFSKAGQQLIVRAYVKLLRREFGAGGFISYIFDRAQRDPARYLKETGRKRTQKLSAQFVGSGFIANRDGYVITARHVVTPDADVKKLFAESGAANFARADSKAWLKEFAKFDLSTGAMRNIVRTMSGFAQAKVHVDLGRPIVAVRLGVASGTGQRVGKNQPAEVVFRSDPALGADVAVLRIRVDGSLPTVPLGSDSPQQGEQVYINAFPAAATYLKDFSKASQLQPTLTKGSITALKTTSGGTPILQTDANAMPGSSGGAAFNEDGQVVGILVWGATDQNGSGAGQYYLMPLDVIKDALSRSGADLTTPSQTTVIYDRALDDFHSEYYSKALGEFQQVKALFPAHAYVDAFIAKSQTEINAGHDKTPPPPAQETGDGFGSLFGTPMIIVGIALVIVVAAGLTVVLVVLRRRPGMAPGGPGSDPGAQPPYGLPPTGGGPAGAALGLPQQPQVPMTAPQPAYPQAPAGSINPIATGMPVAPLTGPASATHPAGPPLEPPQQPANPLSEPTVEQPTDAPDVFPGWEPIDYIPSVPTTHSQESNT